MIMRSKWRASAREHQPRLDHRDRHLRSEEYEVSDPRSAALSFDTAIKLKGQVRITEGEFSIGNRTLGVTGPGLVSRSWPATCISIAVASRVIP